MLLEIMQTENQLPATNQPPN